MDVRQVVPRDAIPSIDDPRFGDAYPWDDSDRAIVVDGATTRAYPLRILDYHEIVNDDVEADGKRRPIAVTWCPLCGSAVVYGRRVGDRTLTFGVSGKLADDDLVMYDRETESEWKQSAGTAIAGPLEGERLSVRPATTTTTVERFRETYPDGLVLQPDPAAESEAAGEGDDPEPVDYDDRPYAGYFSADGFGLAAHRGTGGREWNREDIDPKTVVLGLERDDEAIGVPAPSVEAAGCFLELTVGSTPIVVVAAEGLHAFEDPGYEFSLAESPDAESEPQSARRLVADGTLWDPVTGEAADGRRLARVPARRLFAFAWQADHGPAAFYTTDAP